MARVICGREIRFSASHQLPNVPPGHKCARCHGHSYRVQVELTGEVVQPTGWIFDFGMLDIVLRQMVYDALDHRHLNEIAGLENPTSENLAAWVMARVSVAVPTSGVTVHSVTVHEGDGGGWARLEAT